MKHAILASGRSRPVLIAAVCGLALAAWGEARPAARYFVRGDSNVDGRVNISDPIHLLNRLFVGDVDPLSCADAADEDDNGMLDITDAVVTLGYLFLGSARAAAPRGAVRAGSDGGRPRLRGVRSLRAAERSRRGEMGGAIRRGHRDR